MSSITLTTTGSLGDVLPFVAVGEELRSRGHAVRLLLPTEFLAMVGDQGFEVAPAGFEISPSTLLGLGVDWSRAGGLPLMRRAMRELVLPGLADAHAAMTSAAATSDLVVGHANQIAAQMVAETTGLPWAVLSLFPMVFPTAEGLTVVPLPHLPGPMRGPSQRAALKLMLEGSGIVLSDRALNRFRRAHGLPNRRGYFLSAALAADRVLVPVPEFFMPRPTDWPSNISMTGFCPGALPGAEVPPDVVEFLAAGPPPVLVTLGTASSTTAARRLHQIAEVLDGRGVRALFLVGRDDLVGESLRDRPGVATFAPLGPVLASCRAVIHHGGYGTTAAALGAGVPSIVTPFMPDQQWYGRRIEAVGAGVVVTPRQLRRRLGDAVDHVLGSGDVVGSGDELRTNAADIARHLRSQNGVAMTVDALEAMLV